PRRVALTETLAATHRRVALAARWRGTRHRPLAVGPTGLAVRALQPFPRAIRGGGAAALAPACVAPGGRAVGARTGARRRARAAGNCRKDRGGRGQDCAGPVLTVATVNVQFSNAHPQAFRAWL